MESDPFASPMLIFVVKMLRSVVGVVQLVLVLVDHS